MQGQGIRLGTGIIYAFLFVSFASYQLSSPFLLLLSRTHSPAAETKNHPLAFACTSPPPNNQVKSDFFFPVVLLLSEIEISILPVGGCGGGLVLSIIFVEASQRLPDLCPTITNKLPSIVVVAHIWGRMGSHRRLFSPLPTTYGTCLPAFIFIARTVQACHPSSTQLVSNFICAPHEND